MSDSTNKSYLGDYVNFQNGYAFKSSEYTKQGHYLIRIKNVQQGFIEVSDECFVQIPDDTKFEKFKLRSGDIVVSLTGNVGRIAKMREEHLPAVLNQRVASVSPKSEEILETEYLYYLLRTPEFLEFAIGSGKGAAQQNISTSDMEKFEVHIPSLVKQRDIVKKLDSAFAEIKLLEENLRLSDEMTEQLLKSILSTAFKYSTTFSEQSDSSAKKDLDFKLMKLADLCKLVGGDYFEHLIK
jgi:type I restriction enzyme S subunit